MGIAPGEDDDLDMFPSVSEDENSSLQEPQLIEHEQENNDAPPADEEHEENAQLLLQNPESKPHFNSDSKSLPH